MNASEALKICWYIKRSRPHIAIDQETPATWADQLTNISFEDAKEAVRALLMEQRYVDPSDIRAYVKRIRAKRIAEHPPVTPPPDLTFAQEQEWRRNITRRIGDGEQIDPSAYQGELKPRDMRAIEAAADG